jgi:hypothetical protein
VDWRFQIETDWRDASPKASQVAGSGWFDHLRFPADFKVQRRFGALSVLSAEAVFLFSFVEWRRACISGRCW